MPTAEDSGPEIIENAKDENLFSPGFRSVAAMAGWDEEALLLASLIVEDTPDRQLKQRKRSDLQSFKTPPSNSRRKRRAQRRSPQSKPVAILDLEDDESNPKQEGERRNKELHTGKKSEKKEGGDNEEEKKGDNEEEKNVTTSTGTNAIPCLDKLREELSCAICLEVCYEPSTTPCGHSFCKKCLQSAANKCGKRCPKCRQLISNSRYCTVNTVLWNTIQLLFPQDVEARKEVAAAASAHHDRTSPPGRSRRNRAVAALNSPESERRNPNHQHDGGYPPVRSWRVRPTRRELASRQDEDAALALRLQREEFMDAFDTGSRHRSSSSSSSSSGSRNSSNNNSSSAVARANLRAMASRAINIRLRGPAHH